MSAASQVPEDRCRLPARWQLGAVLVCAAIVLGVFLRLDGINSKGHIGATHNFLWLLDRRIRAWDV
jgi:hypothetical protein